MPTFTSSIARPTQNPLILQIRDSVKLAQLVRPLDCQSRGRPDRFRQIPPQQKNKNLSLHGFDLYRPSKKDTRLQFQVISAIINPAQLDKAPTIITKASR